MQFSILSFDFVLMFVFFVADCMKEPCVNGWCEESMTGHRCHCPEVFSGELCEEYIGSTTQSVVEYPITLPLVTATVPTPRRTSVSTQAIDLTTNTSPQPTTNVTSVPTTDIYLQTTPISDHEHIGENNAKLSLTVFDSAHRIQVWCVRGMGASGCICE